MTLGMDVLDTPMSPPKPVKKSNQGKKQRKGPAKKDAVSELLAPAKAKKMPIRRRPPRPVRFRSFVLTRLHARYDAKSMKDDLIFRTAKPIVGGRERRSGSDQSLEKSSSPGSHNNFQARYAIRHAWEGPIKCDNPVRGRWGGPPAGVAGNSSPKPALNLAFAPRGKTPLAKMVRSAIPEIEVVPAAGAGAGGGASVPAKTTEKDKPANTTDKPNDTKKESKGCSVGPQGASSIAMMLLALAVMAGVRRRRRQR